METPERPDVQLVVQTGNEPVRHHIVPQFYLERFAAAGRVEAVHRDNVVRTFKVGPPGILAENYFYTIETDQGHDLTIEKMFADVVEKRAANAIRRLVDEDRPITAPEIRLSISVFLAFQFVRGRSIREMVIEHHKEVFRRFPAMTSAAQILEALRVQGNDITEEHATELFEATRGGGYTVDIEREGNLYLSTAMPAALEMVPHLQRRSWQLLKFHEPSLLTCDEPVVMVGRDPRSPGSVFDGFLNAPEIVFPTDPEHALVLLSRDQNAPDGKSTGTLRHAEIINRHVAFHSHRFIIRRPGTDLLEGGPIPKKAPSVFVLGNVVTMQPHASKASRSKAIRGMRTRSRGRRRNQ